MGAIIEEAGGRGAVKVIFLFVCLFVCFLFPQQRIDLGSLDNYLEET